MNWPGDQYFPQRVNSGPLLTGYTLNELRRNAKSSEIVLPICPLGTPWAALADLAPLVLPPLYHEPLEAAGREAILSRIEECFPYLRGTPERAGLGDCLRIVELQGTARPPAGPVEILALSVDTAVEEHGPHLPLATDTMQSYAVLARLSEQSGDLSLGPPVEYGHLTWGLPFGFSIDLTPQLLTRYVAAFAGAVVDWSGAKSLYVVDVHGSFVHRNAIQQGLAQSGIEKYRFRWLHEPLVEFAAQRGDQHAGGVETALIDHIRPQWVDARWWPDRIQQLAVHQMPLDAAVRLSTDLPRFTDVVRDDGYNGIVGDIENFHHVDAGEMMQRMLDVARADLNQLRGA